MNLLNMLITLKDETAIKLDDRRFYHNRYFEDETRLNMVRKEFVEENSFRIIIHIVINERTESSF